LGNNNVSFFGFSKKGMRKIGALTEERESPNHVFVQAVMDYIAPVLAEYGFTCYEKSCEKNSSMVGFTSARVTLKMYYEKFCDIDVVIARKSTPSQSCVLSDMLALYPDYRGLTSFQAYQQERITGCIRRIAELLHNYGNAVLAGVPSAFERMEEIRHHRAEAYTKEVVQSPIRKRAEQAWRDHNYLAVRNLYTAIAADLTSLEKRKLAYAEAHIADDQLEP
jgi:hypothetical protein